MTAQDIPKEFLVVAKVTDEDLEGDPVEDSVVVLDEVTVGDVVEDIILTPMIGIIQTDILLNHIQISAKKMKNITCKTWSKA
jgi:hypothetical protein